MMLSVRDLAVAYGPIRALNGVSFDLEARTSALLAGANGSGKSTLLRAISGLAAIGGGDIHFEGRSLRGLAAHQIASLGIAHVPEGRRIWPTLTVREHLQLAGNHVPTARRRALVDDIVGLFPRLKERWTQDAARLSGGEQQMVAIGRGLAADPKLLLIDELSLGLAPVVVKQLFAALDHINGQGVALLIVEQALHAALAHARYGYVLERGTLVVHGTPDQLRASDAVRKAYLSI
ncbi:MAG TPA: ABC transporter ATP-binding protein [Vicinamibacterales bacterium]|nr:ABC transporter ATP-binding protein [Vicinamibacterales bacterium]